MSAEDEPRVWAKRDRTIVPPQRRLARTMRATPTEAERKLWWHLRHRLPTSGTHFRRQVRIGRYIADFACHATRIVIEVDGGQHDAASAADEARTKVLEANGYRVLRYWNNDVLTNIDGVARGHSQQNNHDPHLQPLPTASRACPTCALKRETRASPGFVGRGAHRVRGNVAPNAKASALTNARPGMADRDRGTRVTARCHRTVMK
jgi:very-short-patch-repair endonuclease